MNELKEHQFCESDEFFREYHGPLSNETHLYYLKSEADKVLAELIEKNERLSRDCLTEKEIRHHKYKRCLAMARWCHNQREIYERDSYNWELDADSVTSLRNKANIMRKWRKRWLELAERFK